MAPEVQFVALGTIKKGKLPLAVRWPAATPDGAPIDRYQLQRSLDGGPWVTVSLPSRQALSVNLGVKPWTVARFQVRAVDTAGNWSDWAVGDPLWLTTAQESDPAATLSAGWQVVGDSNAYGRRRATTSNGSETAVFSFVGREVAWVARLGPNRGQAGVSVDGGSAEIVDLVRPSASSRRVVYQHSWSTVGPHTLEITTTSADALVDVDAFLVLDDSTEATLIGAGDIAACTHTRDSDTAALMVDALAADPTVIAFTAGDNVYPNGGAQWFADCYEPTWGVFKAATRPVPGNHDYYQNPGAGPYFAYFGPNAGIAGLGWYRYEAGTWRIYALNSQCRKGTACYDAQYNWLKADLAAEPHRCVLAMWHRPLFSTGVHGNSARMDSVFKLLYDAGAEIVITGHDHGYQRFAPADVTGTPDAARGVREFVVGTGGAGLYAFPTDSPLIEVRDNTTYGVMRLDLTPGGYAWEFLPVPAPGAFTDSGTGTCH